MAASVTLFPITSGLPSLTLSRTTEARRQYRLGIAIGWIGATMAFGYRTIDPIGVEVPHVSYLPHCKPIVRTCLICRTVDVFRRSCSRRF